MKVAPVSADLLVKLALGVVLIGAGVWAVRRAQSAAAEGIASVAAAAWETVADTAWALSPANQNNVIYQTANAAGGAIFTAPDAIGKNADGSWTLGGAIFDIFNPDTAQAVRDVSKPVNTGGATGSW